MSIETAFLQEIVWFTGKGGCNVLSVHTVFSNMELSKPFFARCN